MNRLPQVFFAMVPVLALAGAGCAGQLDDEARFLDAGSGSGGSSGTGGSTATGGSSGAGMGGSAGAGMSGAAGMGGSGPGCDYMTLLNTSCALAGCHAAQTASAGINLSNPQTVGALVGMKATSGACMTVNNVLVVDPATPANSLLYVVTGEVPTGYCGYRMPLGTTTGLPAADRACLLSWIKTLPGVTGM